MAIEQCKIIQLKKFEDPRGSLIPIESGQDIPFPIQRVYYFSGVPSGMTRGSHAHKTFHEVLIPICGSFDVLVKDGKASQLYHLASPHQGLYLPPMNWVEVSRFSQDAICLVLVSAHYNEMDYYRDYSVFLENVLLENVE